MLTAYAFKELSPTHGKVVYVCYYPVSLRYVRITMHDDHVNNILTNMAKSKKYLIKLQKPSVLVLNSVPNAL